MTPIRLTTRCARAFSLVEVLIAVLVLSLGLLGLGAVFPMVMREQRLATESNLGISAGNAIEQMLFSRPDFARNGGPGWEAMREYLINNNGRSGEWIPIEPDDSNATQLNAYIFTHPDTGVEYHIPLAQRLYPVPYSTDQDPRFVWDMAARLLNTSPSTIDSSPMLVAIFLRPIDPGIRPAIDTNGQPYPVLSTLIDSNLSGRDRRNPVSVDQRGRPTQDGRRNRGGTYAMPIVAEAIIGPGIGGSAGEYDKLVVQKVLSPQMNTTDAGILIAVSGQQFLDYRGYVHTVTGTSDIGGAVRAAIISPSISDVDGDGSVTSDDYNPILFLPQPSNVKPIVFTVNP